MKVEKEKVLSVLDEYLVNRYQMHILNQDGQIDYAKICSVLAVFGNDVTSIENINNVAVDLTNDGGDFKLDIDENSLILFVPKELREKIEFEVEYVLSGFDKIQKAISYISKEFQIDRQGVVANSAKELRNFHRDPENVRKTLENRIGPLGDAIEQFKKSIDALAEQIGSIPRDRKKRLLRTPITTILALVQNGRQCVYDYVYATGLYAEINMWVGSKESAKSQIQDAIEYLEGMVKDGRFERVEQWNEKKDGFWEEGIEGQIVLLKDTLEEIKNYNGRLTLQWEINYGR